MWQVKTFPYSLPNSLPFLPLPFKGRGTEERVQNQTSKTGGVLKSKLLLTFELTPSLSWKERGSYALMQLFTDPGRLRSA
jgi:hypothetical protein